LPSFLSRKLAGPGSARRFWFFWRTKEQNKKDKKFVHNKETKREKIGRP